MKAAVSADLRGVSGEVIFRAGFPLTGVRMLLNRQRLMHPELTLVSTIAVSLAFAFVGGLLARRFRLPLLVGYLLAGVAVGPSTPGFVADEALAPQLAEIGVMLLMFGVGMHFSLRQLLAVKNVAVPGAIGQILVATVMGAGLVRFWGWSWGTGLVFGLALSVASTVVLLRALEARGELETPNGRIAVGWLIVEDLVMVLALILLPALASPLGGIAPADHPSGENLWLTLGLTLGKVAIFVAVMLLLARRFLAWLLKHVVATGSRELFILAVITLALGIAYAAAQIFGVSFALGAFIAGMVVNGSDHSARAAKDLQPLQDVFSALFFVSVGMLFDPAILAREPLRVLAVVVIIMAGKAVIAYGLVRLLRRPASTALEVAAALTQIGEFSFILAALGLSLGLLSKEGQALIVAGALLSIVLNPLAFRLADHWRKPRAV